MDCSAFFSLMQRGAHDEILRAIERNPGIVSDTWGRPWGEHWDRERWRISGDVGWDDLAWPWAFWKAGYTDNHLPATKPTGPIRLYRGAPHDRRFGMGWTTKYDYAHKYAVSNLIGVSGHVYLHWAWGEELFAHVHNDTQDEYVLDTRYLNDHNVAKLPLAPTEYAALYTRCITARPAFKYGA
ncbi:hypothetical protein [Mycobacterium avium]|nr:hypothetical protein [Mycobacterium avium]